MYNVLFVLKDRQQGVVMYDNKPAMFESEDSAWKYIHSVMIQPEHPAFMWIRKVGEASV